jgi:ABC-type Na+ efflux pump permease subunit
VSAEPPRAPGALSSLHAAIRVFDLTLGQMLWSRRTIFLALVAGGPVLIAFIVRIVVATGLGRRLEGAGVEGAGIFGMMIWVLYVRFLVPVLGVFYGVSLIADEVEDKTITYLFTRPIRRGAVLLGKFAAYLVCTVLVVLPSVMLVYFLIVPFAEIAGTFPSLLVDLGILAAGLAVYGALFALIGALFKRPLVIGLAFAFGWEQVAMLTPGSLKTATVAFYLQSLVPHAMPSDGVTSLLQAVFRDTPSAPVSLACLFGIGLGSLLLGIRAVERREYVLEQ